MSLIHSPLPFDKSPLPDLAPEDKDLAWLEDQRTTSPGEGRGKLVTDLAELLKRCVFEHCSVLHTALFRKMYLLKFVDVLTDLMLKYLSRLPSGHHQDMIAPS